MSLPSLLFGLLHYDPLTFGPNALPLAIWSAVFGLAAADLTARAGKTGNVNRYAPAVEEDAPQFTLLSRKAIAADDEELAENPRSRSAKLRVAVRTDAPAGEIDANELGMPQLREARR